MRLILSNSIRVALGIVVFIPSNSGIEAAFAGTHGIVKNVAFAPPSTGHGVPFVAKTPSLNVPGLSLTALSAKPKKKKVLVTNFELDDFEEEEPLSKKDQIKAQKAAAKAAKKEQQNQQRQEAELDKESKKDARAAALAALENMSFDADDALSAKEKKAMEKKAAKEAKKAAAAAADGGGIDKKQAKALKALEEMERMEAEAAASDGGGYKEQKKPKLSKKEQKLAARKAEKEAAKAAKKAAKKAKNAEVTAEGDEGNNSIEVPDLNGSSAEGNVDADVSQMVHFPNWYFTLVKVS
jgi:hypothetical protein